MQVPSQILSPFDHELQLPRPARVRGQAVPRCGQEPGGEPMQHVVVVLSSLCCGSLQRDSFHSTDILNQVPWVSRAPCQIERVSAPFPTTSLLQPTWAIV